MITSSIVPFSSTFTTNTLMSMSIKLRQCTFDVLTVSKMYLHVSFGHDMAGKEIVLQLSFISNPMISIMNTVAFRILLDSFSPGMKSYIEKLANVEVMLIRINALSTKYLLIH